MSPGGRRALLLVILAVGVFQVASMRDGFQWFHDSVAYVTHAENLASGRDYARSGYIPNPYRYIAPKAYPPGYPILLAPVVKVFGSDPDALRMETIVLLLLLLAATARIAGDRLPAASVAVAVGAIGLQPLFRENMQRLLSDIPFLLFVVLALGTHAMAEEAAQRRWRLALGALAGAFAWYAIITRSLGAVLIPAVLLHELIRCRFRRMGAAGTAFLGAVVVLSALWSLSPVVRSMEKEGTITDLPPNPYLAVGAQAPGVERAPGGESTEAGAPASRPARVFEYRHSHVRLALSNVLKGWARVPQRAWRNGFQYASWGTDLLDNGHVRSLSIALFVATAGLAAAGFVRGLRRRRRAYDVFVVLYFLALLPWSFGERRYLFPLVPFGWIYVLAGIGLIAERFRSAGRAVAVAALVIAATYAARYTTEPFDPIDDPYTNADGRAMIEFLGTTTDPGDPFLAEYPRQLAYFTGHPVTAPHPLLDERCWWPHARWLGAPVVVVGPLGWPGVGGLADFVEPPSAEGEDGAPRPGFRKVFERGEFRVYRMEPPDGS